VVYGTLLNESKGLGSGLWWPSNAVRKHRNSDVVGAFLRRYHP